MIKRLLPPQTEDSTLPKEENGRRTRKRRRLSPTPPASGTQPSAPSPVRETPPRKKKRLPSSKGTTPPPPPQKTPPPSTTSSGANGGPRKSVSGASPVTAARTTPRPTPSLQRKGSGSSNDGLGCNETLDEEEEEEEEESECSAPQCLQPVAEQISWVQCDHCQEWFHIMCVGLTEEYAMQIDTYICVSCKESGSSATVKTVVSSGTSCGGSTQKPAQPVKLVQTAQT